MSLSGLSVAGNSSLFSYDKNEITTEFSQIQQLESVILINRDITISDLELMEISWLDDINLEAMKTTSPVSAMFTIDDMDWGAFAWGWCCCPIGFFVVAIDDTASQDSKTSYWVGVIVSAALSAISSIGAYSTGYY